MRAFLSTVTWLLALLPALAVAQVPIVSPYGGSPLGHVRAYSGVTGAVSPGTPMVYGFGGVFEPRAMIMDFLALGLRVDGAALGGLDGAGGGPVALQVRMVGAAMVKAELSLLPGELRPFVGFGAGWCLAVLVAGGTSGLPSALSGNAPMVMPQVGLDLSWFRVAGEYHLLLGGLGQASYFAIELAWRVY